MKIAFRVYGIPKTAGSKKAFYIKSLGRSIITDDCNNKDWRNAVALAAREAHQGDLLTQPLDVRCVFHMPRPKGHYRTGARSSELRPNAATCHTTKPDATKLWRCAEDALTGVVWRDDAQIWSQAVTKVYSDKPGVEIWIQAAYGAAVNNEGRLL